MKYCEDFVYGGLIPPPPFIKKQGYIYFYFLEVERACLFVLFYKKYIEESFLDKQKINHKLDIRVFALANL